MMSAMIRPASRPWGFDLSKPSRHLLPSNCGKLSGYSAAIRARCHHNSSVTNEPMQLALTESMDSTAVGLRLTPSFDVQRKLGRLVSGNTAKNESAARERRRLPVLSVAKMLEVQRSLTAVERFSERHTDGIVPTQAKYYRSLLPAEPPRSGQQLAFEVDLDRCTGCKACVSACHSLNGLDENELWRNVGLVQSLSEPAPRIQTVTSSCHHCVEPACMKGCPVGAYEKDAITGIVKHLDDQCFGCQYCTLMCPYDAPKFSQERGIVRKCDMCSQRLEVGEAPACVQACPNEAIRISVVEKSAMVRLAEAGEFIAGAPSPQPTKPTTQYKSTRALPHDLAAVDRDRTRIEHTHWPLVIMLTLTQLGAGTLLFSILMGSVASANELGRLALPMAAFGWTGIALSASVFHLGRPLLAWRAVLNLKTSWLSREALAFGIFAQLMLLYLGTILPESMLASKGLAWLRDYSIAIGWCAALAGIFGVFCSVMVYVATRRVHWSWWRTGPKFFGTLAVLGSASIAAVSAIMAAAGVAAPSSATAALCWVILFGTSKLIWERSHLQEAKRSDHTSTTMMARTMLLHLEPMVRVRFIFGTVGCLILPLAIVSGVVPVVGLSLATVAVLVATLAGEVLERAMFFRAAPGSRMPGALS